MKYYIEMRKVAFTVEHFRELLPSPHLHTHLELIFLREGRSEVTVDNQKFLLKGGEIFLVFPNQIHFYQDQGATEGYQLIFTPEVLPELKEVFMAKMPVNPIVKAEKLSGDVFDMILTMHERIRTEKTFDGYVAKGQLLSLVSELLSYMELVDKPGDWDTSKRILSYCLKHYKEPLTLDYLAKELYLSKYYISHIFRERMNINYKDFINQLRMEHVCDMLKKEKNITEAAFACGFSSVRTFNRVFLRYVGMTPREYIKIYGEKK